MCCSIHVKVEEKITLEGNRDGGLEHMEVKGTMFVSVSNEAKAMIQLRTTRDAGKSATFQVQPRVWGSQRCGQAHGDDG